MRTGDRTKSCISTTALEPLQQKLIQTLLRQVPEQGLMHTALDGLALIRCNKPSTCTSSVYAPSLYFNIQGSKTLTLGDKALTYEPLSYATTPVHLPLLGRIDQASASNPFLGIKLAIDPQEVANLVLELGDKAPKLKTGHSCNEVSCGLSIANIDSDMLDAVTRLVKLLENPQNIPILAPLVRREIIYRSLMSEVGVRLRKFSIADSQANRVCRIIEVLKDRFSEPLRISELAHQANMSESSLYQSFKQITRVSPLQFQKKLRLHEARRLMLSEGLEASAASYRVGYESPSHFSREYSRMFGLPPRADVDKLRSEIRVPA
ncbi:MAG: AraC family transcriptional regulator [Gammaproteobacteria bacterium]|nr:AraC family transcriptional regulator [Gammaproteobacteria bacterium]